MNEEELESIDLETDFVEDENRLSDDDLFFVEHDDDRPKISSPEWSDWVMGQLTKKELSDANPTCDGLRRVAIKLFGMMDILPPIVHNCSPEYAAVTAQLKWPLRTVCGSAEVHSNNTDNPFAQFPLATAETRAISRALRLALNLTKVVTAEEVSRKANISIPITDENRTEGGITDTQIKYINMACGTGKGGINVSVKHLVEKAVGGHNNIKELSFAEALQVNELINKWKLEKPENTPEYDPNWQSSF